MQHAQLTDRKEVAPFGGDATMFLTCFLHDVYAPLRAIDRRTVQLYEYTIASFGRFLGRPAELSDLEELLVARFLMARSRERAAATAAKDRSQLRALWEFAARRNLTPTWPTIPLIRVPERTPVAWMADEMIRLVEAAKQERAAYDGVPAADWWRAALLVAYDTGERCTAVLSLRWCDVGLGHVVFRAETRKGKRRDSLRDIGDEASRALQAIRCGRSGEDLVFPWPRTRSYLWKRLGIILERAGLPHSRQDKFHRIRRTTASFFEAAGGSAQHLLDHADPATTRRYLDPRIVRGKSAPGMIPPVGGG